MAPSSFDQQWWVTLGIRLMCEWYTLHSTQLRFNCWGSICQVTLPKLPWQLSKHFLHSSPKSSNRQRGRFPQNKTCSHPVVKVIAVGPFLWFENAMALVMCMRPSRATEFKLIIGFICWALCALKHLKPLNNYPMSCALFYPLLFVSCFISF